MYAYSDLLWALRRIVSSAITRHASFLVYDLFRQHSFARKCCPLTVISMFDLYSRFSNVVLLHPLTVKRLIFLRNRRNLGKRGNDLGVENSSKYSFSGLHIRYPKLGIPRLDEKDIDEKLIKGEGGAGICS